MNIIVAKCLNGGIGYNNTIPWHCKEDLKRFSKLTKGNGNNAIIMGKNTWLSLPKRPLPGRDNLVISTTLFGPNIFPSIIKLKEYLEKNHYDEIWIIGGEKLYNYFLKTEEVKKIYITTIYKYYTCDVYFPIHLSSHGFHLTYQQISTHEIVDKHGETVRYEIYEK
uniref:dihydrofolate reductase n=1 Tax=viral metagenome TaxID=1070528 RepID=A0A6C0KHD5_9ZZZZ